MFQLGVVLMAPGMYCQLKSAKGSSLELDGTLISSINVSLWSVRAFPPFFGEPTFCEGLIPLLGEGLGSRVRGFGL